MRAQANGQFVKDEDKGKGKGKQDKGKGNGVAKRGVSWVAEVKAYDQNWNGGKAPTHNQHQKGDWDANNKRSDPGWGNNWATPEQQRQHW